ncbi:BON domain-containing protein [Candidatus Poribacteria bacterium]|nr:BON domain-containing protein [Candidatus Poribacteria bacterium]
MFRKLLFIIFALAALVLAYISYQKFYARSDMSGKDFGAVVTETRITASVKTALALNRHLNTMQIDVSASDGVVTLSGAVATDIQKQLAEEVARSIKGVERVQNDLVISRTLTLAPDMPERTLGEKLDDLTIVASVKTALLLNQNIRANRIEVSSNRGAVVLGGTVESPAEAELARKIAEDIDGVVSVEIRFGAPANGRETGDRSIMKKADDARIVAQVRAALMVNRNIDSSEIEASSREGIVTLTGIVNSGAEKDLAQEIAKDCWGVQGVVNELRIKQK